MNRSTAEKALNEGDSENPEDKLGKRSEDKHAEYEPKYH